MTVVKSPSYSLEFAYEFHQTMKNNNLILAYEGEVTQQLTKAFSTLAESNLEKEEEAYGVRKKVFHIMVECLQNVAKHSDDPLSGLNTNPGSGIFLVGKSDDIYHITTGNVIANDKIHIVRDLIEEVNAVDPDDIKAYYKEKLRSTKLSDKSGAGLGFIDMVKKTGSKIDFHFEPINDKTSFFLYKVKVKRKK